MVQIIPREGMISAGDIEIVAIDYQDQLDADELLTGSPTVVELTTTDLTIDNEQVTLEELTIQDRAVPTGMAVQFKVSGQVASTNYKIKVTVDTDSDPARRFVRIIKIHCRP